MKDRLRRKGRDTSVWLQLAKERHSIFCGKPQRFVLRVEGVVISSVWGRNFGQVMLGVHFPLCNFFTKKFRNGELGATIVRFSSAVPLLHFARRRTIMGKLMKNFLQELLKPLINYCSIYEQYGARIMPWCRRPCPAFKVVMKFVLRVFIHNSYRMLSAMCLLSACLIRCFWIPSWIRPI